MMRKANVRLLAIILAIVSIVSMFNIIFVHWFPIFTPFSSFTSMRLAILAVISKYYWLFGVCIIICAQLFSTALSVYKHHILLPVLSLIYEIIDFSTVLSLLIDGLSNGFWKVYISHATISFVLVVLLILYFITERRSKTD